MTTLPSILRLGLALALAATAGAALPQAGAPPADAAGAVKQRRDTMVRMLSHSMKIEQMVYGMASYKPAEARAAADEMVRLIAVTGTLFPPGSVTADSKARPEIWQQPERFAEALAAAKEAYVAVQAAAKTDSLDALKAAYVKAPPTCLACHNAFVRP